MAKVGQVSLRARMEDLETRMTCTIVELATGVEPATY